MNSTWISRRLIWLILFLTFLAFSPALSNQFVWDDSDFILHWPLIESFPDNLPSLLSGAQPQFHAGVFRPVRNLLYTLSYQLFQTNPFGYHLQAISLHLFITYLVYRLSNALFHHFPLSLLTALIFGLHPLHVEAIAWTTTSYDIFGIAFLLLSFLIYLRSPSRPSAPSLVFALLSFLTYEMTLVLPLLVATHHFFLIKKNSLRSSVPYFALAAVYLFVRFTLLPGFGRTQLPFDSPFLTFILMFMALGRYLYLLVLPLNLSPVHYLGGQVSSIFQLDTLPTIVPVNLNLFHPDFLVSASILLTLAFLIIFFRHTKPLISFLLVWLVLSFLPVMQFAPQLIIFAEKYTYLASIAFALLLAKLLLILYSRLHKPAAVYILCIIFSFYFLKTYTYTKFWQSDYSLWSYAYTKAPQSATVNNNLAAAYLNQGKLDLAGTHFQTAVSLNPTNSLHLKHLADFYLLIKNYPLALETYLKIDQLHPQTPSVLNQLGLIHIYLNQPSQAAAFFRRVLTLDPSNSFAREHLLLLTPSAN